VVNFTLNESPLTTRIRYLYERELYSQAESTLSTGLDMLSEKDSLTYAAAVTLQGLIELDTSRLSRALRSFLAGLQIRTRALQPDDEFIASSLNAISLAYTELNELDQAVKYGQDAIDIRLRTRSERIGNSYSNMASTLLRMGKANESEEMLGRCPSLKDFTDETFLTSGNPRFAG
jgi:tetratricopeptide (TPR) repeat protein